MGNVCLRVIVSSVITGSEAVRKKARSVSSTVCSSGAAGSIPSEEDASDI